MVGEAQELMYSRFGVTEKSYIIFQVWYPTLVSKAPRRVKDKDLQEFEVNLSYIKNSAPAWATNG